MNKILSDEFSEQVALGIYKVVVIKQDVCEELSDLQRVVDSLIKLITKLLK